MRRGWAGVSNFDARARRARTNPSNRYDNRTRVAVHKRQFAKHFHTLEWQPETVSTAEQTPLNRQVRRPFPDRRTLDGSLGRVERGRFLQVWIHQDVCVVGVEGDILEGQAVGTGVQSGESTSLSGWQRRMQLGD